MSTRSAYSIAAVLRAHAARSWDTHRSLEHDYHQRECEELGPFLDDLRAVRVPGTVLQTRDMTVAGVSGSNFLVGTQQAEYVPFLEPFAAPLALGARVESVGRGGRARPRGTAGAVAGWLSDENAVIPESQPTIGVINTLPKTIAALTEITHLALKQSNSELVVRQQLARAAAGALTAAILAGSGASGQPLGISGTSGIGGFTGASLNQGALRNAQEDIANAIADRRAVGYISTPAVATLLSTRQRFTGSDRALWEGASHDGQIEGLRALTTTACPAATMYCADWSQTVIEEWVGGLGIQLDPFSKFNNAIVGVRLIMLVDVHVERPAAFSLATAIS